MNMKANELMIGDLVSYRGIVNRVAPADFCHFEWIDEIRPIPLTDEILRKNFSENPYYEGNFYDDNIMIDLVDHSVITRNNPNGNTFKGTIYYVHELQNLLHILGIDKEIKL